MKRWFWILTFTLILWPVGAQDHSPVCRLKTKHDRVTDTTTVQCEIVRRDEGPLHLSLYATASFQGDEPNEKGHFWFSLHSNRSSATRQTQPLFHEAHTLRLQLDGKLLETPIKDYRRDYFENVRQYAESARAEIRRADLSKLLAATTLTGQWGSVEFKFSAAELAALKDFLTHQVVIASTQ